MFGVVRAPGKVINMHNLPATEATEAHPGRGWKNFVFTKIELIQILTRNRFTVT